MATKDPRPGRYKKSWADRFDPGGAGVFIKVWINALFGIPIGLIFGLVVPAQLGWVTSAGAVIACGALGALGGFAFSAGVAIIISNSAARAVHATIGPGGKGTPYEHNFSLEDSFIARGEYANAMTLYDDGMRDRPDDVEVRVRAAELASGKLNDPARAAVLWKEIQRHRLAPPARVLYATQRLVDVLLLPGGDRGRALVELRRLVEQYPQSRAAQFARDAIARLKSEDASNLG